MPQNRYFEPVSYNAHLASESPVTDIHVGFRQASDLVANGLHAFIDISRADGGYQRIAAFPYGGDKHTGQGGELRATTRPPSEERMHPRPTLAEAELHAPPGMTLTQYGDKLLAAAKEYNKHTVRYDGIASEGYNSNSFIGSLISTVGGEAGHHDLERMTHSIVNAGPNTRSDGDMAYAVLRGKHEAHYWAPGLMRHFESGRFEKNSGIPPQSTSEVKNQPNTMASAVGAWAHDAAATFASKISYTAEHHEWPTPAPTYQPYIAGDAVTIEFGGHNQRVGPGFESTGRIERIHDGVVVQQGEQGEIKYRLGELLNHARNPEQLAILLRPNAVLKISIDGNSQVEAENVRLQNQAHESDLGRGRSQSYDGWGR